MLSPTNGHDPYRCFCFLSRGFIKPQSRFHAGCMGKAVVNATNDRVTERIDNTSQKRCSNLRSNIRDGIGYLSNLEGVPFQCIGGRSRKIMLRKKKI